jgi:Sigma-54 interaction domain
MPLSSAAAAGLVEGLGSRLISSPEWHGLSTVPHNALFEGPAHATACLLIVLQPYLRRPTVWSSPAPPLELPTGECGALVLQNVWAFNSHDQAALLKWINCHRTQVVSTSTQPLFPLIARGLFDEALYYRLNATLLRIGPSGAFI